MSVGQRTPRLESARLLVGGGRYLADCRLPRMYHAAFVRSDQAHARLLGVDVTGANSVPGVLAVLTAADLPAATLFNARQTGLVATEQPVLARDLVRFCGEAIAVVLAEDRYAAEDGVEAVVVDYEPLEVAIRADQEPTTGALLFGALAPGNIVFDERRCFGQVEEAFARSELVVRRQLHFGRQSAAPIETRGALARYEPSVGTLDMWASTQSPHAMRRKLARVTGLGEHRIAVHFHDIGGAFGQKIPLHPEEAVVALAAMAVGGAVKWVEDRRENLLAAPHGREQHVAVELALSAEGRFLAMRADACGDAGAYSFNAGTALTEPYLTARSMLGPYRIDNYEYRTRARLTNKSPMAPYRGVGFVNAQIIRELVIDDAARIGGWDRVELRRTNLVGADDFPYTNAVGMVYDSGSYLECLDAAVASVTKEIPVRPGRWRRGWAVSSFVEPTAPGSHLVEQVWGTPSAEGDAVRVSLDPSARATVSFGTPSIGQGVETAMAQVVAEELGFPLDAVAVAFGDTSTAPLSLTGTRGSRTAVIIGGAAAAAATEVRGRLLDVGAHLLESAVEDLVLDGSRVFVRGSPDRGLTLEAVVNAGLTSPSVRSALGEVTFSAVRSFDPPGATYSNGCVGVAVSVEEVTGAVALERVVVAHDCGTVINPAIVEGQLAGAAVQGFGGAVLEELRYSADGQLETSSFMDYLLPTAADVVDIEFAHFESPSPHTWRGVKGAGEAGTIGTTAAVIAAVADALGERASAIDDLPLRPSRLADLLAGHPDQ